MRVYDTVSLVFERKLPVENIIYWSLVYYENFRGYLITMERIANRPIQNG